MMQRAVGVLSRHGKHTRNLSIRGPRRGYASGSKFLKVSEEVQDALQTGKPVVSLETTIYTHGFPHPKNITLSEDLESIVRQNGAVPATIGVLNGVAKVGMSSEEMVELLDKASKGWQTVKLSRRDIGWICGQGLLGKEVNGGTTVAGTLILSHLAGIKVFATGGLGGVHKGGEASMDVSADLTELGRTPVALISSGCKSFLDIPRTLEYLETQGVGVGTFADGRSGAVNFPAFWTRDSGVPSPRTIFDEKEAAAIIHAQLSLPLSSGLLFANPIEEKYSLSKEYMDNVMNQAVQDAAAAGVTGHANTPYVLDRIRELTGNETLEANRELVATNVARGAKVACELAKLDSKAETSPFWPATKADKTQNSTREIRRPVDLVVAGCIALDISGDYAGSRSGITTHTSNPGRFSEGVGGVGRNIACAATYAGAPLEFCSVVGDDSAGRHLLSAVKDVGMSSDFIKVISGSSSGRYIAFNDNKKDLFVAMADMRIIESSQGILDDSWKGLLHEQKPRWIALDANWDAETLQAWIAEARRLGIKVAFEPVSEEKSTRILSSSHVASTAESTPYLIDLATPNVDELRAMRRHLPTNGAGATRTGLPEDTGLKDFYHGIDSSNTGTGKISIADILEDALDVSKYVDTLLITIGKHGVLMVQNDDSGILSSPSQGTSTISLRDGTRRVIVGHFPIPKPVPESDIVSVNGVGDTFFGVLLAGLAGGRNLDQELVTIAQSAAALTLQCGDSVSPKVAALRPEIRLGTRGHS